MSTRGKREENIQNPFRTRVGKVDKVSIFYYKGSLFQPHSEEEIVVNRMRNLIGTAALLLFVFSGIISAQEVSELSNIDVQKGQDQMEIKVVVTGPISYESFTLFNPNRLVIDLLQTGEFRNPVEVEVNGFGVSRIRTARNQPDVVRVVFDLDENVPSYSIEDKEGAVHIIFRVEREAEPEPEAAPVKTQPERLVAKPAVTPPPSQTQGMESDKPSSALSINLGGGVYMPQSTSFQDIYGTTSTLYSLGLGYTLPLSRVESLGFSLEGSYISDSGNTTFTDEQVKLTLTPVMLNVFYQRSFGSFEPYAGIGASYFSYKEDLPETFPVPEVSGSLLGYNFLIGTHVKVMPRLSIRAYLRYHVAKKTEADETEINLSGNELGIGLSYFFDF